MALPDPGSDFLYSSTSPSQQQKEHFDKFTPLPQPSTEEHVPRVEKQSPAYEAVRTWRCSAGCAGGICDS